MPVQMAQYGTKHSHAAGKIVAMQENPDVELVGVYEPDAEHRAQLADSDTCFATVHWFKSAQEMLADPAILAVASEGLNVESLDQTEEIVAAGKHVWYDKSPGDNWAQWQRVVAAARDKNLLIQMGYMLRYHDGFSRIADWANSGLLGHVFAVRAHMSTNIPSGRRKQINAHRGGIFYELAGHMLDQIIWILGRPAKTACFLRTDDHGTSEQVAGFADNTLGVFEFDGAMAMVDIAAMETQPMARRYEVYGTAGSAIVVEPFEPGSLIRLCLAEATEEYSAGVQMVPFQSRSRQELYDQELKAFLRTIAGEQEPDRLPEHDLLVQETLLRAVGTLVD
ncbi:MAG: Gfo/Idh/MocA family oxidoreductase [Caldilineaceae bacterium SB0661_bin_32]|uniref:Gfo/Idh/MocA family oxidoreductase n=1 Tax=Caldilineaceae bacterium SB0661_bin_32 TaxID=2605255 RepID=A0A6B1D736_9CHLR|nr:Gfo/Idh/MocA family oxidoreductase [Caldilineaceae bacterium SB0661_bin_32]